ncbi:MAG TPA: hypothetical protein VGJ32_14965 [Solirubrobacteraceae bacterium]|jgi:hypothetical protein
MRAVVIALSVLAFLAASALVARWLTTDNAERAKVTRLLQAQARGDARAMLRELDACAAACAARARANARRLRRGGPVQIVAYESATSHALRSRTGVTRVVWKTPDTLTVVQCVRVRRSGSALGGLTVRLLGLSGPIPRTAGC